jgi:hypothetical protein
MSFDIASKRKSRPRAKYSGKKSREVSGGGYEGWYFIIYIVPSTNSRNSPDAALLASVRSRYHGIHLKVFVVQQLHPSFTSAPIRARWTLLKVVVLTLFPPH